MLKTLASAPAAVAATGSPIASAAIVALNVELAYLLADLVKSIDDDIEGITQVQQNYRNNEDAVIQLAVMGTQLLCGASRADRPQLETRTGTPNRVTAPATADGRDDRSYRGRVPSTTSALR